jgi:alkylation response protein AidB-like acyl-CoA dehydrogenase/predicted heme/steroid binding protein
MSSNLRSVTLSQVSAHNKDSDCWIVIDGHAYDVTKFLDEHPGGKNILMEYAGKDASEEFWALHSKDILQNFGPEMLVGKVSAAAASISNSDSKKKKKKSSSDALVAYADPYWCQGLASPFYTESHRRFGEKVRAFVDKELLPYVHEWDEKGAYPMELHEKAYKAGVLAPIWPAEYGGTPPEGFDAFHDLIWLDELARCGAGGVLWAVFFSFGIALPPILNVGSQYLRDLVARDVITGKKIMSLAVTEPYAGSDVAALKTTAVRQGDYFIVNGEKKFITSGTRAHYFTVAVRTGGAGMRGVSLLLVDRSTPGVKVRRQKTQGWWISSTAYVTFENVRVPVKNLIGKENDGFRPIMHNFNHERFALAAMSNRYARCCLEDAIKYARRRKTFGKRLIDHQVIRHKIMDMARHIESTHGMLERVAYQMKMGLPDMKLAGLIALTKVQATKTMELCAREASQVLGGASYIRGGIGGRIERLYREVRVNAIGGGSEEIMIDLAAKMAKL